MKKKLLGLAIAGVITSSAFAGGPDFAPPPGPVLKPFVGVYYSYLSLTTPGTVQGVNAGRYADSYNGIGFEFGLKYGHYVGMAWGWTHYFRESRRVGATTATANVNTSTNARPENYFMELRAYWPIYNFDLIGAIGANIFDVGGTSSNETTGAITVDPTNTRVNIRFGVGADYFFTPNWGITVMWNYVPNHSGFGAGGGVGGGWENFWTINAGITYMFS